MRWFRPCGLPPVDHRKIASWLHKRFLRKRGRLMVQLSLEPNEQDISFWALESAVSDPGAEVGETENQEFWENLKERKAVLRKILLRL